MKIQEAIDRVDILKPNHYTDEDKISWLNRLDGQIWRELVSTHEQRAHEKHHHGVGPMDFLQDPIGDGNREPEEHHHHGGGFRGYDLTTPRDTELLAEEPYTDVYIYYLMAQIDLGNAEIAKYNNDKALYNSAYLTYSDYYTRTHKPLSSIKHFRL